MRVALDEIYLEQISTIPAGNEILLHNRQDPRMADAGAFVDAVGAAEVLALAGRPPVSFDRRLIESLPNLQFIHKPGSGLDQFDLPALSEHGILLSNNPGGNASCVAEHAVMLVLVCLRGAYWHMAHLRQGIWHGDLPAGDGFEIGGKTVGIIGLGQSGTHIARRLIPFGVDIIAHQRHPRPEAEILAGVRWVSLDDLLRESDVVIPCVPLTKETRGMIGARELSLMKRSAVLVNCSRGGVVDERALYEALVERRLLAAGLDVFEMEPTPADNPLLKLENVFATPHVAGRSAEVNRRKIERTMENVRRFLSGRRPLELVNPEVLEGGAARAKHLIPGSARGQG